MDIEQSMSAVIEQELVNKTTNLLSILSKKDALSIFLLAKDGLKGETLTPQKIGLTRKQYYTRLRQLVDSGLIDKSTDTYMHTTLGTFVYQHQLLGLLQHVRNEKQMKMVDTLKRTKQFSEEEIGNFVGKLTGSSIETSSIPQVRFSTTYEQMVSDVLEQVQFCKNEIFLASRFQNDLIINSMLHKADSGANVKMVIDREIIRNYALGAGEKLDTLDRNSLERIMISLNPYYPRVPNVGRRISNVPFCILIVDRERVGIEIVDKFESDKFKYALFVKDKTFAEEVGRIFERWWVDGEEDNVDNLRKLLQEVAVSKSSVQV